MAKNVYTSTMIVEMIKNGVTELILNPGDIITPLARDIIQEKGINLVTSSSDVRQLNRPSIIASKESQTEERKEDDLEEKVRKIVLAMVSNHQDDIKVVTPKHIDGREVKLEPFPFEINRSEMDVRLKDVITSEHQSPMGVGFMSMHKGSFPWKLTYDEIEYVIEGELHIGLKNETLIGLPGDVLFIPKGTEITFGTPSWAKFLYVTYPAEWA